MDRLDQFHRLESVVQVGFGLQSLADTIHEVLIHRVLAVRTVRFLAAAEFVGIQDLCGRYIPFGEDLTPFFRITVKRYSLRVRLHGENTATHLIARLEEARCARAEFDDRKKYGQMSESEAKRLKGLEKENTELKKMYADAMLSIKVLKEAVEKKL